MFENNNKTCRLCLYKGDEIISIFNTMDIPKRIKDCVGLEIQTKETNDRFSSMICLNCLEQLNQWYNFKEMCHKNNNLILESIKDEKNEFTSNNNSDLESFSNGIDSDDNKNFKRKRKKFSRKQMTVKNLENKKINLNHENINDKICLKNRDEILQNSTCDGSKVYGERLIIFKDEDTTKEIKKEIDIPYVCDICNSTFNSIFEYLDHQENHNGEPVFKCQKCSEIFKSRKDLVEHDSRHQIPCPLCNKLILPSGMKAHKNLHTDKYKCTECNWRFSNSSWLRQHIESVHIRLKSHVCETCGKSFTSTTSLQTHIKIHSNIRPYICKLCDYSGRTASALYTHMATHEDGLHSCEICNKSFKSHRSVRDHTRRVHSNKKNHECGICNKKFIDKYMLTVHIRSHTGARPYQCNICERAFVRSDGLKEHLATHGERPNFSCDKCGKTFIYRRSLSRHNCNNSH